MARTRLRPLRREPIRIVDAVVVQRAQDVPPSEEYRDRAGEYISAALDNPSPPAESREAAVVDAPLAEVIAIDDDPSPDKAEDRGTAELAASPADETGDVEKYLSPPLDSPAPPGESPLAPVVAPLVEDIANEDDPSPDKAEDRGTAELAASTAAADGDIETHVRAPMRAEADDEWADEDYDLDEVVIPIVDATKCTIAVWRGYRKARFYAQTFDSHGGEVALAESPPFRYRGNGLPERDEAALRAHRALVDLLCDEGWRTEQAGTTWFDLTFTRD